MKHQTIDDGEPIPAFLGLRRNLALVGGEGEKPEPEKPEPEKPAEPPVSEPEPAPAEPQDDPPPLAAVNIMGTEIDQFRAKLDSERDQSASSLRVIEASIIEVTTNRDAQVDALEQRFLADKAAILKRANDQLLDLESRKAQHEAIVKGCDLALEGSK